MVSMYAYMCMYVQVRFNPKKKKKKKKVLRAIGNNGKIRKMMIKTE